MNTEHLGDSYDIVKRFFCEALRALGYDIYIEPMLTDKWRASQSQAFYKFLGVKNFPEGETPHSRTAIFIDPDTGITENQSKKKSEKHLTFEELEQFLDHGIAFAFDQSFSRATDSKEQIGRKLDLLKSRRCFGFYYDSHARFLFTSREKIHLQNLRKHLLALGLPKSRIITNFS